MSDPKLRSLAKTVTYRVVNMLVSFVVFTLITGSPEIGAMLMVADATTSSFLFYGHERMWNKIRWGLSEQPRS